MMKIAADRLLLFGATGDLAQRMLLPSLCALDADRLVSQDLRIVGTARSPHDDASYRAFARRGAGAISAGAPQGSDSRLSSSG